MIDRLRQNPLFDVYGAVAGYLPARRIAVSVATTIGEGGFDDQINSEDSSHQDVFAAVVTYHAPDHPLPMGKA